MRRIEAADFDTTGSFLSLSPQLQMLITGCLTVDPSTRATIPDLMRAPWFAAAGGGSGAAAAGAGAGAGSAAEPVAAEPAAEEVRSRDWEATWPGVEGLALEQMALSEGAASEIFGSPSRCVRPLAATAINVGRHSSGSQHTCFAVVDWTCPDRTSDFDDDFILGSPLVSTTSGPTGLPLASSNGSLMDDSND
eukprot:SAG11_NODE_225_length_12064_cov_7.850815_16_plen_193_part_00